MSCEGKQNGTTLVVVVFTIACLRDDGVVFTIADLSEGGCTYLIVLSTNLIVIEFNKRRYNGAVRGRREGGVRAGKACTNPRVVSQSWQLMKTLTGHFMYVQ